MVELLAAAGMGAFSLLLPITGVIAMRIIATGVAVLTMYLLVQSTVLLVNGFHAQHRPLTLLGPPSQR